MGSRPDHDPLAVRLLRHQSAAAAGRVRGRAAGGAGDDTGRVTGTIIALYRQNELQQVAPGNEAEFALETYPGRIIKGTVNSIVWAQGAGQLQAKERCR